jgi:hypothetical protein
MLSALLFCSANLFAAGPQTLCYSIAPNPHLDAHAADIKKIYDGFFFVVGSWEFTLRITDENGIPIPGVRFRLQ